MQNSWTMNIKQNVMSRTRITHDKFRTNKVQNDRQSAFLNVFLIISEILHELLLPHTSHSHQITPGDFW